MTPLRVRIRRAGPDDLAAVHLVETASYSTPWTAGTFRTLLEKEGVVFHVAEAERGGGPETEPGEGSDTEAGGSEAGKREIVGHAVLWRILDEAELANLAVAPSLRGRGIGGALLDRTLDSALASGVGSVFLEVRDSNHRALALYRKRGFRQVGVRRQYYDRPREDALILRLDLRLDSRGR